MKTNVLYFGDNLHVLREKIEYKAARQQRTGQQKDLFGDD